MSHSKTRKSKFQSRNRRSSMMLIAAISVIAIAALTVVAAQVIKTKSATRDPNAHRKADKQFVTVKVAGQDVQVESQTGQVRPLTAQEAQQLAEGLKQRLNRSTAGLVEQRHEDGSVSMDLQGRFPSVVVARKNDDGTITKSCVDNPRAAASFFGIDPKLLGVESPNAGSKTPVRKSPVKN